MGIQFRLQYSELTHSRIQISSNNSEFSVGDRIIIYPFVTRVDKQIKPRRGRITEIDGDVFINLDFEMVTVEKCQKKQILWGYIEVDHEDA